MSSRPAAAQKPPPSTSPTANPGAFTSETAREARKLRGALSQRMETDIEIERGLRRAAKSDPRAAEVLLRWLARPRDSDASTDNMDGLSLDELERIHQGLQRLCSMDPRDQARVLEGLLDHAS